MYFNEKEDTNIDSEFSSKKSFDFDKYKKYFIIGGIILLTIIIIIILLSLNKKTEYFLTLDGLEEMTIYQGTSFNEPGYTATDNKKNDLSSQVKVKNNIDTNTIGTYTVIYTIGNQKKTRTVNVVAMTDSPTVIHLSGDKTIYLKVGNKYDEPGYTAIDSIDGNITNNVTVNGEVNTSKKGTYRIVYSVVNSGGIATSETRTVIVE